MTDNDEPDVSDLLREVDAARNRVRQLLVLGLLLSVAGGALLASDAPEFGIFLVGVGGSLVSVAIVAYGVKLGVLSADEVRTEQSILRGTQ